jgi:hypothetical protein
LNVFAGGTHWSDPAFSISRMASKSQETTQRPQPIHRWESIRAVSSTLMASIWQRSLQTPQAVQFSWLTVAEKLEQTALAG